MKIALYGGSFNPVHNGHLLTALYILENFDYDTIYFIPAYMPVHKNTDELADGVHRLAMLQLATQNIPSFKVSDVELSRKNKSYTIDTVDEFYNTMNLTVKPGVIIGDDLLPDFHTWKDVERLTLIADILCLTRHTINKDAYSGITFINNRIIELSSREIRKRINNKSNIDFMLPYSVKKYIEEHNLYKDRLCHHL